MKTIQTLEPEIQKSFGVSNPSSISGGLSSVFELLFSLSIISALVAGGLVILWAGALRLGGMGGSSSTNISKSKDFFMRVFVVFIVVLPLTLFLRVINPDFLNTNVSLSGIKASLTKVQTDTFQGGGGSFGGGGSNGTSIPVTPSGNYPWPTGAVPGKGVVCNGGGVTRPFSKPSACMDNLKSLIIEASNRYGIDKDVIRAVIYQESGGNPNARSPVGALGLMQIMPATASSIGCQPGWEFNEQKNIDCGTKYLKQGISSYGLLDAYAGYNGGYGTNAMGPSSFCSGLKRWQCAFDSADLSVCNTGFVESRNYAIMMDTWVKQYKNGACSW